MSDRSRGDGLIIGILLVLILVLVVGGGGMAYLFYASGVLPKI